MNESNDAFVVRDARQPNHFWTDNEIYLEYSPIIGVYAFAVYCALCYHVDSNAQAYPSHALLARQLKISRNTVRQALAVLADVGLIRIEPRITKAGDATSNLYTLANVKSLHQLSQPGGGSPRDLRHVAEMGGSPDDPPGGSPHDPGGSPRDPRGSPRDPRVGRQVTTKNNHLNKTQVNKTHATAGSRVRANGASAPPDEARGGGGGGGDEGPPGDRGPAPPDVRSALIGRLTSEAKLRPKQAAAVVASGLVSKDADVDRCVAFVQSSDAEKPPAVLWSEWLSQGQLPPAPEGQPPGRPTDAMSEAEILAFYDRMNRERYEHGPVPAGRGVP